MNLEDLTVEDVQSIVNEFLEEQLELSDPSLSASLDSLGIDSLTMSELIVRVEIRLGIGEINVQARGTGQTLNDFSRAVHSAVQSPGVPAGNAAGHVS